MPPPPQAESEAYESGTPCGVTHVVLLKLQPSAATPDRIQTIVDAARTLPAKIGQIQEYRCGVDLGLDPSGQTLALVAGFKCKGCYGPRLSPSSLPLLNSRPIWLCRFHEIRSGAEIKHRESIYDRRVDRALSAQGVYLEGSRSSQTIAESAVLCCVCVGVPGGYAKHDEHVAFVVEQVKPYLQPGARVAAQFARE